MMTQCRRFAGLMYLDFCALVIGVEVKVEVDANGCGISWAGRMFTGAGNDGAEESVGSAVGKRGARRGRDGGSGTIAERTVNGSSTAPDVSRRMNGTALGRTLCIV